MTPPTPHDLSETELLRRVRERDKDAFEELIERHMGLVFSIAMRVLRNKAEAEELTQETFWRVIEESTASTSHARSFPGSTGSR